MQLLKFLRIAGPVLALLIQTSPVRSQETPSNDGVSTAAIATPAAAADVPAEPSQEVETPAPEGVKASAAKLEAKSLRQDPTFERYVDVRLLRAAFRSLNPELMTDVAAQFVEGERVLHRSHASISAAEIVRFALSVANRKQDQASLVRLAAIAGRLGDEELVAELTTAAQLADESRAIEPGLAVSVSDTSVRAFAAYQKLLQEIDRRVLRGDVGFLERLQKQLQSEPKRFGFLSDESRQYVDKLLAGGLTSVSEEGGKVSQTLALLSSSSRGWDDDYGDYDSGGSYDDGGYDSGGYYDDNNSSYYDGDYYDGNSGDSDNDSDWGGEWDSDWEGDGSDDRGEFYDDDTFWGDNRDEWGNEGNSDRDEWDPTVPVDEWDPTDPGYEWDPADPGDEWDPTDPGDEWDPTDPGDEWDPTDPGDEWEPLQPNRKPPTGFRAVPIGELPGYPTARVPRQLVNPSRDYLLKNTTTIQNMTGNTLLVSIKDGGGKTDILGVLKPESQFSLLGMVGTKLQFAVMGQGDQVVSEGSVKLVGGIMELTSSATRGLSSTSRSLTASEQARIALARFELKFMPITPARRAFLRNEIATLRARGLLRDLIREVLFLFGFVPGGNLQLPGIIVTPLPPTFFTPIQGWWGQWIVILPRLPGDPRFPGAGNAGPGGVAQNPRLQWSGNNAKVSKRGTMVINSAAEWKSAWQKAHGNERPVPAAPTIDFKRYTVLGVFLGNKPTSGYSVAITSVRKSGPGLVAVVSVSSPKPGDVTMQAESSPYFFRAIPASKSQVKFAAK